MTDAARLAFAANAFLTPDTALLSELAGELEDTEWRARLAAAPLEPEYNRLFYNPAGTPCPPWQSAQGADPVLMGDSHLSALEWYRRFGVEPVSGNDPADHIGLLLLFYAQMRENGASDEDCARFAAEHLAWIPEFCDGIAAQARHPFYRDLAQETRRLIDG